MTIQAAFFHTEAQQTNPVKQGPDSAHWTNSPAEWAFGKNKPNQKYGQNYHFNYKPDADTVRGNYMFAKFGVNRVPDYPGNTRYKRPIRA